jgi:hypothetical protein
VSAAAAFERCVDSKSAARIKSIVGDVLRAPARTGTAIRTGASERLLPDHKQ